MEHHILYNSTVNICAIDLAKSFEKTNHSMLYKKLMKRLIGLPNKLLLVLENLMSSCFSCVNWSNNWSSLFIICSGVRQGAVLSPFMFVIYIDEVDKLCDVRSGSL